MEYLKPDQTACSARIFLNIFGYTLEDRKGLEESDKLIIFDNDNNQVGEYYLEDGKAYIKVKVNNNTLSANYRIPELSEMTDWESNGAKSCYWTTPIGFEYNENDIKLRGLIILNCGIDTEFGIRCRIHSEFGYLVNDIIKYKFRMFKDGTIFEADMKNETFDEKIDLLVTYNEFMGYSILHRTLEGKHLKFAEIDKQEDAKRLIARDIIDIDHNQILSFINSILSSNPMDDYNDALLKDIESIKEVDPAMFLKIKLLLDNIKVGDTKIIENLVKVSYDTYPDEIIKAIFDVDRDNKVYQNGANNLTESYFGKNNDTYTKVKSNL